MATANQITAHSSLCDCLEHPFQTDPGVSQEQRVMSDLLGDRAKIDARNLADLLSFFQKLSLQVNHYDASLLIGDWKPFFEKSIPFVLSSIITTNQDELQEKFKEVKELFNRSPSAESLQLVHLFLYYQAFQPIDQWYTAIKGSGLPVEKAMESLLRDRLRMPLARFIAQNRLAAQWLSLPALNFSLYENSPVWTLPPPTELALMQKSAANGISETNLGECQRIKAFLPLAEQLFLIFSDVLRLLTVSATQSLEQSLFPLKEELQKKHMPHLALLFAFLKLFQRLQGELNGFTRKHLDYFYKQVLQISSRTAVADRANLVFSIQKVLDSYLLQQGVLVKDGKDINKEEILFALDNEIVVNQAQVKDVRTLFLNYHLLPSDPANTGSSPKVKLTEGVYMAPDAQKADGIDKEFQTDVKNFYTLGNRLSKYIYPLTNSYQPYPNARLGFILASPVLLLREGTRTVTITLECSYDEATCQKLSELTNPPGKSCCDEPDSGATAIKAAPYKLFFSSNQLFTRSLSRTTILTLAPKGLVPLALFKKTEKKGKDDEDDKFAQLNKFLNTSYYYISRPIIAEAEKKGMDKSMGNRLRAYLQKKAKPAGDAEAKGKSYCYCEPESEQFDTVITDLEQVEADFATDLDQLSAYIQKKKPLNLYFSGEKEWLEPSADPATEITLTKISDTRFTLQLVATLNPDKDAVVKYDAEKLKEDFDTQLPCVKIELDDHLKIERLFSQGDPDCCVERPFPEQWVAFSFYHLLRNAKIEDSSTIDVQVCGLRKFVVQNDESLQDVNAPIYPFGSRPIVGSNFYIGSEELFSKKWDDLVINLNWKGLPDDLAKYYEGYQIDHWDSVNNQWVSANKIDPKKFKVKMAVLQDGEWFEWNTVLDCAKDPADDVGKLFQKNAEVADLGCDYNKFFKYQFALNRAGDFPAGLSQPKEAFNLENLTRLNADTRRGFMRITLACQDFQHENYPFILARQMAAVGKLPNDIVEGAVYYGVTLDNAGKPQMETLNLPQILSELVVNGELSRMPIDLKVRLNNLIQNIITQTQQVPPSFANIWNQLFLFRDALTNAPPPPVMPTPVDPPTAIVPNQSYYKRNFDIIVDWLRALSDKIKKVRGMGVVIPNEPYTPIISEIALDYTASAGVEEIGLVHLYPYTGTYRKLDMKSVPSLLPVFCDEGTLFLGLEKLKPGNNLNILFQMAEATADSESEKEEVFWYYLDNNTWRPLRPGFEVLDDGTENLTRTGIMKFALPENMTDQNTIMPKGLHWIKAAIPENSRAVCETTGIHTQAISATFTNSEANDKMRLAVPLAAGQLQKLETADASVKQVQQLYETFGGRLPEDQQQYYVRVSEQLRHKGRAIQKWDYERIVLEAFPEIYRTKCINHSFALDAGRYQNDFPYAPGYVVLAVIPDLTKLKAGNSFEPKAPVSLLEKIEHYIRERHSPFVRFSVRNPRYEKIHLCLRVKLVNGKDEVYYKEKLKNDLRLFLAPWAIGNEYQFKLSFGLCVNRSTIIQFLESLDYVDFVMELFMRHEKDPYYKLDNQNKPIPVNQVCPVTPRSILVAGDIDACVTNQHCEAWQECYDDKGNRENCCDNTRQKLIDYCDSGKPQPIK